MTHYHFIGIGGAGLAPIARFLQEKGNRVSGSDLHESANTQELKKMGVTIFIGHQAFQMKGADMIIRSSAIPDNNVEVLAGKKAGIPVLKRSDFLGKMTAGKKVIAIAGTHGKTTTTAMICVCLNRLELDPSFVIGGTSKDLATNAHAGQGEYFVIEADEYDRMFLGLSPFILVITNIEHDHPDHFPTEKVYFDAFLQLTERIQSNGMLVACGDHPGTVKLLDHAQGDYVKFCYGKNPTCKYQIDRIQHQPECGTRFGWAAVKENGVVTKTTVNLQISGEHNALNAAAALAVVHLLGQDLGSARQALENFSGTGRRFDIRGEIDGVVIIDDYAHHPSEIRATLSAARCRFPKNRIWAVWQPHTYSRTKELAKEFTTAFENCDHLIVTDIFASREKKEDYSSKEIVEKISNTNARHIGEFAQVSRVLVNELRKGDILLVLSAGDADQISRDVLAELTKREMRING